MWIKIFLLNINLDKALIMRALLILSDIFGNVPNTALSFRVALKANEFVPVSCMVLVRVTSIGQETVSWVFFMHGMKCMLKKINLYLNITYMRDRSVNSNRVLPQGNVFFSFKLEFLRVYSILWVTSSGQTPFKELKPLRGTQVKF
jgi:hypothetical protein